jgi:hypothetical protein
LGAVGNGDFKALGLKCDKAKGIYSTDVEVSLCCRSQKQCKMCAGTCGGNYQATGNIYSGGWNGDWGAFSSQLCNENIVEGAVLDKNVTSGVNLCCLDQVV